MGCSICVRLIQLQKSEVKKKNHIIISGDAGIVFLKVEYIFMLKTHCMIGIEGCFLDQIKNIYQECWLTSY